MMVYMRVGFRAFANFNVPKVFSDYLVIYCKAVLGQVFKYSASHKKKKRLRETA